MRAAKATDLLLRNKTLGRSACNRNSLIVLTARAPDAAGRSNAAPALSA